MIVSIYNVPDSLEWAYRAYYAEQDGDDSHKCDTCGAPNANHCPECDSNYCIQCAETCTVCHASTCPFCMLECDVCHENLCPACAYEYAYNQFCCDTEECDSRATRIMPAA